MAKIRNPIIMVGGGTDISDTTAVASDVLSGKDFYLANGTKTTGTIQTYSGSTTITQNGTVATSGKYLSSDLTVSVGGTSGDITNSTTVTKPASGSVTANSFVKLIEAKVSTSTTLFDNYGIKQWYQISKTRFLWLAGSGTTRILYLYEINNGTLSTISSISISSLNNPLSISFVKEDNENYSVFCINNQFYAGYFRFSLVGDVLTLTKTYTSISGGATYGYNTRQADVVKIDTDKYLMAWNYSTGYCKIVDTSTNTWGASVSFSGYAYADAGVKFIYATSTMALLNYSYGTNQYGRIARIDIDLANNALTKTDIYSPSNTSVMPGSNSYRALSAVRQFDNFTFFMFFGGTVCKIVCNSDYSSATVTREYSGSSSYYSFGFCEAESNPVIVFDIYGSGATSPKSIFVFRINNDGTLSTHNVSVSNMPAIANAYNGVVLTEDDNKYICVSYQTNWIGYVTNDIPEWYSAVAMLSSNSDTIYGVSKNSASDGENVSVMIPNVT